VPERLNQASIQIGDGVVVLPWSVRDELLERARKLESLASLGREIEGVGATRPAELDDAELHGLSDLVDHWIDQTRRQDIDPSVFTLRHTLAHHFAERQSE
jgi:hypothetical protein